MSARPEEAMVLWVPGEIDDRQSDPAAVESGPLRMARSERTTKPVAAKALHAF
jgi:hypothetical protein